MIERLLLGVAAAVMVAGGPVLSSAAIIEVSPTAPGPPYYPMYGVTLEVRIDGRIEPGDADTLERAILDALHKVEEAFVVRLRMRLNSPGGHVKDAMEIGRMTRAIAGTTMIIPGQRCDSSCALIFVAGVNRWNLGVIGVHRPYYVVQPNAPSPSGSDISALRSLTLEYLREMNVPDQLGTRLLDTSPRDMYLLWGNESRAYISEIDPVHEDLSAIRDARVYGIDTASYFRLVNAAKEVARHTCQQDPDPFCDQSVQDQLLWGLDSEEIEVRSEAVRSTCLISPSEKTQVTAYVKQQVVAAIAQRSSDYLDPEKEHPALKRNRECIIETMRERR